VLAVTRLRLPADDGGRAGAQLPGVLAALAAAPGFMRGRVGESVDEPGLLVLVTEWSGAGAYRRGLSAYDVKIAFAELMAYVLDEPSAFEVAASIEPEQG
jgi:quinol monooxygenase YgiN